MNNSNSEVKIDEILKFAMKLEKLDNSEQKYIYGFIDGVLRQKENHKNGQ